MWCVQTYWDKCKCNDNAALIENDVHAQRNKWAIKENMFKSKTSVNCELNE